MNERCDWSEIRGNIVFCRHPDCSADGGKTWGPALCVICPVPPHLRRDESKHTGHERDYD